MTLVAADIVPTSALSSTAGHAGIEVRMFGSFSITVGGVPVPHWQSGKARALFQYLVLERGWAVPRTTLEEALWPDQEMGAGSSSLRVAAHTLRRQLVCSGPGVQSALRLETTPGGGYRLATENVWVDVLAFDRAMAAATAARREGALGQALAWHRQATALYQSDLLAEEDAPWIDLHRHGLRSAALAALEAQLQIAIDCDDGPEVVELARTMLKLEPHREGAYRALILQHGRMGQLRQVDSWFRLCTSQLRDELDVPPDASTRQTYTRAIRGELERRPRVTPQR